MPTNSIGRGNTNFPVCMPVGLRREAGRLATMRGQSLGAFLRSMVAEQVNAAKLRGELAIEGARQLTLGLGCWAVVAFAAFGLGAVIAQALQGGEDPRRARIARRARVRRNDWGYFNFEGMEDEA